MALLGLTFSHVEKKERNVLLSRASSLHPAHGKTQRPLHILVLSDCIWFVFRNNSPEMEALPRDWWLLFLCTSWKFRKGFFPCRSHRLLVHKLFPLCCRIDLQHWCMSLYIFLTGLSQSISQQVFHGMMDDVARSLPAMFPLKGWAYCH